jgi:uncharacterized protein
MSLGGDDNEVGDLLPMFPLGSVLFPHVGLPLRVFEPRYRQLVLDCLDGDNCFGVVLIERGSEVGGGDARFGVGTIARITDAEPLNDGTWAVSAIGTQRVQIQRWERDNPYPRAHVTRCIEAAFSITDRTLLENVIAQLRVSLELRVRVNLPGTNPSVQLNENPAVALWQACAIAPVGSLDALKLLEAETAYLRLELLRSLLSDHDMLLKH